MVDTTVAPVCRLPNQGQVPALQAGVLLPSIPRANNLPTVVAALNVISQIVIRLMSPGLPTFSNNLAPQNQNLPGGGGGTTTLLHMGAGPNGKDGKDGKTKPIAFKETKRKKQKVKIVALAEGDISGQTDDDTWIIVERITQLEFTDSKTGSKLVWTR